MTKFRILVAAVALGVAAPAFAADAELDGSWDTKYGMVFQAFNPLQNSSWLAGYGGIGLQYNLAPTRAVRATINLTRTTYPDYVLDHTTANTTTSTTTHTFAAPIADNFLGLTLGADYLMRLGTTAMAPYAGVGAVLDFGSTTQSWEDKYVVIGGVNYTEKYDKSVTDFGLGVSGILGLEWRIHKMISIFAEYRVTVDLYSHRSSSIEDKLTNQGTGAWASTKDEYSFSRALQISTGLTQGALLGVLAHF
jgi:hypothetical protein